MAHFVKCILRFIMSLRSGATYCPPKLELPPPPPRRKGVVRQHLLDFYGTGGK